MNVGELIEYLATLDPAMEVVLNIDDWACECELGPRFMDVWRWDGRGEPYPDRLSIHDPDRGAYQKPTWGTTSPTL